MDPRIDLRPTIDREWLESAAEQEPVEHAYTLWDLDRFPDRIRIVSAVQNGRPIGYLLVWRALPGISIVHWHGTGPGTETLARALPDRPFVAIVPPEARAAVVAARGPAREYPELVTLRSDGAVPAPAGSSGTVRRLGSEDAPELEAWAGRQSDRLVAEYPGLDLATEVAWGAFRAGQLVGVARAAVRLPREWIVAGVYVAPDARGRGFGSRLVSAIALCAAEAGARVGLYVREDRAAARRLYDRLGFRTIGRRIWLDLGAGLEP